MERQITLVTKKPVLNLTLISLLVIIALGGTVSAVMLVQDSMDFNVSDEGEMSTNFPVSVNAFCGDNYTYEWNFKNNANNALNYSMSVEIGNVVDNEVKINIRDENGTLLGTDTDGSVDIAEFPVNAQSWLYSSNATIELQFNQTCNPGTKNMTVTMPDGTFTWSI